MPLALQTLHPLALLLALTLAAAAQDFPLAPAQECRPRAGLPNFFAKATTAGAEVKVGFLGGSITAQPGWRPKTLAHFQKTFPTAKFSEINAAIGGTGSDLGVFRLQQDVLDAKPDLLFVEFAVNDGLASPEQIFRCMEGIVRQTWRTLPQCDIAFVYTITEQLSPALLEGKFPRAASAMEKVADHYGIPTIHLCMEVARLAKDGKLVWKAPLPKTPEEKEKAGDKFVFAPDGVHPHVETGHELYLQAVARSLPVMREASKATGAHKLAAPFIATNYEHAKLLPISAATLSKDFALLDAKTDVFGKRWANRMTALHKGSQAGATLSFKFRGTRAAIYDIIGPDCGQVIVTVDDQSPRIVPRFDSYCTYHRLATLSLGTELPDQVHTVKIEIHPQQPDKVKMLARLNTKMDQPERYDGTAFYPGAILIVGELAEPRVAVSLPTPPARTQKQPVQSQAQAKGSALADAKDCGYTYGKRWAPLAAKGGVLSLRTAPSNFELADLANIQWAAYSLGGEGRSKIAEILTAMGSQADYYQVKEVWQAGFKSGVADGLKPEMERYRRGLAPAF